MPALAHLENHTETAATCLGKVGLPLLGSVAQDGSWYIYHSESQDALTPSHVSTALLQPTFSCPWTLDQHPSQGLWNLKEEPCGGRKQMEPVKVGGEGKCTPPSVWFPRGTPAKDL